MPLESANRNLFCGVPEWAVDQKEPHFPCHWLVLCLISLLTRISPPVVFGFISCSNEDLKSPGSRMEEREQGERARETEMEEGDWKGFKNEIDGHMLQRRCKTSNKHHVIITGEGSPPWDVCLTRSSSLIRALRTGGRPWTWRADCWRLTARATARAECPPTTPQTLYRSGVMTWEGMIGNFGFVQLCTTFCNNRVSSRSPCNVFDTTGVKFNQLKFYAFIMKLTKCKRPYCDFSSKTKCFIALLKLKSSEC